MNRWALPGPAEFLAAVANALREGASVVVGASLAAHSSLARALEDHLADDWRIAGPCAPTDRLPIDELYSILDVSEGLSSRRSIASLLEGIERKQVVLVSGVGAHHWHEWHDFILDYASASRALSVMDRTQLLIVTAGVPKAKLPGKAPALSSLVYDGVVGESDVFGYVLQSWRLSGRRVDASAKLIARIITRLALWDFDLIEKLLKLDHSSLFDPALALNGCLGDSSSPNEPGNSWELGGAAEFDGEQLEHSLSLLRRGDPSGELGMRLWAAQASELLPTLEICRRQLADRMKAARLRLPVNLKGEMIHDLLDVEIGPLAYLARTHRLPRDIVRLAEKYANLRNKLAHLSPLSADEALDPEVLMVRRT